MVQVLNGPLGLAQFGVGVAPVVVGVGIPGVEADSLVVVLDGPLVLAQISVGDAPVVVSQGLGVEADSFVVVLDSSLVLAQISVGDAPIVVSQGAYWGSRRMAWLYSAMASSKRLSW